MTDRREYRQGRFVYLLDDNDHTAWIQSGHIGRCKTYRVPEYVDIEGVRYTITRIEHYAYNLPRTLQHLIIPDSIEYVDEDVLDVLPNLKSVFMGKGVESLSSWNFRRCPKLRNFRIDSQNPHLKVRDGLVLAKNGTSLLCKLFNRKNLKELNIPEGVEIVAPEAFSYEGQLETISFPSSLREIHDNSFSNLPKLKRIIIPDGLERLTIQCFMDNENLEYVDLPATVKLMGGDVFMGCHNLKKLIIRSSELLTRYISYFEPEQYSNCRLYVSAEILMAYRKDPFWGRFMYILPILESGRIEGEIPDLSNYASEIRFDNDAFVKSQGNGNY